MNQARAGDRRETRPAIRTEAREGWWPEGPGTWPRAYPRGLVNDCPQGGAQLAAGAPWQARGWLDEVPPPPGAARRSADPPAGETRPNAETGFPTQWLHMFLSVAALPVQLSKDRFHAPDPSLSALGRFQIDRLHGYNVVTPFVTPNSLNPNTGSKVTLTSVYMYRKRGLRERTFIERANPLLGCVFSRNLCNFATCLCLQRVRLTNRLQPP